MRTVARSGDLVMVADLPKGQLPDQMTPVILLSPDGGYSLHRAGSVTAQMDPDAWTFANEPAPAHLPAKARTDLARRFDG